MGLIRSGGKKILDLKVEIGDVIIDEKFGIVKKKKVA
mgnify:CR=1 FL=1|jgi:hypothetical protein